MRENGHRNGSAPLNQPIEDLLREGQRRLAEDWTLPSKLFNDHEVHDLERERVFGQTWVFLGHEIGDRESRRLLSALHRRRRSSSLVATSRARFAPTSTAAVTAACRSAAPRWATPRTSAVPYHGWTYRNTGDLVGVPAGTAGLRRRVE